MNKLLTGLFLLLFLASCGGQDQLAMKQAKLEESKTQLMDLEIAIKNLETEIAELGAEELVNAKPVKVERLQKELYRHAITIQGMVESDMNVMVSAESSGIITSLPVREGQYVNAGQVLAKLDTDILNKQVGLLKKQLELAQVTFEKQEKLWKQEIGSEIQYLQAKNGVESLEKQIESIQAQLDMGTVRSPISGVVDEVLMNRGELAGPGAPIARVVNNSDLKISADVSEHYIGRFEAGDVVDVVFPVLGDTVSGRIRSIGNVIDPNNRTFKLVVGILKSNKHYKPNMMALIAAYDVVKEDAVVVPSRLVNTLGDQKYIYIAENDIAKKAFINVYTMDGARALVDKGLNGDEWIVVDGHRSISDGDVLKILR